MLRKKLTANNCALMVIDVQERLFPHLDHECEFLKGILKVTRGMQILGVPIIATEQYPEGLGKTVEPLRNLLGSEMKYLCKTTFSCGSDPAIRKILAELEVQQVICTGIEAHICVLQTAWDLLELGKEVVVINDAITSRSIYDFSTAIAEMRDLGVRITSSETVLFEILGDSKAPSFKAISELVQSS